MELRADDAFWAARRVVAFTEAQIRAAVHAGNLSDPNAERHLGDVIIETARQDRRGLSACREPDRESEARCRRNADVRERGGGGECRAGTHGYRAAWFRFDNATGATSPIGETSGTSASLAAPAAGLSGDYIAVDVSADAPKYPAWQVPARIVFRRTGGGWKLVGLERLPEKLATESPRVRRQPSSLALVERYKGEGQRGKGKRKRLSLIVPTLTPYPFAPCPLPPYPSTRSAWPCTRAPLSGATCPRAR